MDLTVLHCVCGGMQLWMPRLLQVLMHFCMTTLYRLPFITKLGEKQGVFCFSMCYLYSVVKHYVLCLQKCIAHSHWRELCVAFALLINCFCENQLVLEELSSRKKKEMTVIKHWQRSENPQARPGEEDWLEWR